MSTMTTTPEIFDRISFVDPVVRFVSSYSFKQLLELRLVNKTFSETVTRYGGDDIWLRLSAKRSSHYYPYEHEYSRSTRSCRLIDRALTHNKCLWLVRRFILCGAMKNFKFEQTLVFDKGCTHPSLVVEPIQCALARQGRVELIKDLLNTFAVTPTPSNPAGSLTLDLNYPASATAAQAPPRGDPMTDYQTSLFPPRHNSDPPSATQQHQQQQHQQGGDGQLRFLSGALTPLGHAVNNRNSKMIQLLCSDPRVDREANVVYRPAKNKQKTTNAKQRVSNNSKSDGNNDTTPTAPSVATPIQLAAFNGDLETVQELLRLGCKVIPSVELGRSTGQQVEGDDDEEDLCDILSIAARRGHIALVEYLLGINNNSNSSSGNSSEDADLLLLSAETRKRLLCNSGDRRCGWRAIHYAAQGGHVQVFVMLAQAMAEHESKQFNEVADIETRLGETALLIACATHRYDMAHFLVTRCGVRANGSDKNLATPLQYAVAVGSPRITKLLLSRGAKPSVFRLPAKKKSEVKKPTAASRPHLPRMTHSDEEDDDQVVDNKSGSTTLMLMLRPCFLDPQQQKAEMVGAARAVFTAVEAKAMGF